MRSVTAAFLLFIATFAPAEIGAYEAEMPARNALIVKFENPDPSKVKEIEELAGVTGVTVVLDNVYNISIDAAANEGRVRTALHEIGVISAIFDDKLVAFDSGRGSIKPVAQPAGAASPPMRFNAALQAAAVTPNDPGFADQWYLHNTGQLASQPGLDINAPEAWEISTGPENSIVAVIGSGVDYTHEDLAGSLWTNPGEIPNNNIDDDQNGYVDDVYGINTVRDDGNPMDQLGAGTAQAGIIAAQTNNGIGISGISWKSKVLSCNYLFKVGPNYFSYISDVLECFDYVVRLKKKTDADITSVVIATGSLLYRDFFREVATELDALGILLIVGGGAGSGSDLVTEFPLGYDLPNTIGVQYLQRHIYETSPPFDWRSFHSVAPGDHLLTTFPGHKPDHDAAAIYTESFEAGTAWQADPLWSFTSAEAYSGARSATFSIGNETTAPFHVTSPPIDLTDHIHQPLGVSLKVKAPTLWGMDGVPRRTGYVRVMVTWPGLNYWEYLDGRSEESQNWRNFHFAFQPWIKNVITDPSQVQFRVEFSRDALYPAEVYVDDLSVGIMPATAPSNDYVLYNGTAASAAVVAGAAELIKAAFPKATPSKIKNMIMTTGLRPEQGDPAYYGTNVSVVQLWDAAGSGVVNCAGAALVKRTWPKIHVYEVAATGQESRVRAVSTDCGNAGAAPVMQRDDGGPAVVLADDGNGHDRRAGDGDFAGSWSRNTPGLTTLSLAGDVDLLTEVLDSYNQVTEIPFEWRDMSNAPGGNVIPDVPFPIKFGNHPTGFQDNIEFFDIGGNIRVHHLGVNDTQLNAQSLAEVDYWNTRGAPPSGVPLGTDSWGVSVLGFVNHTDPLSTMGRLRIDVLGTEPNREWVIQYHNVTTTFCRTDQNLKAQVIFFENSSDIQMNYKEFSHLCGDPNWLPHVGIQYNDLAFTKYEGPISDETSLVFSAEPYDGNLAPVASTDVVEVTVDHGTVAQVDLAPYFSDPDGDPLTFYIAGPFFSPGISISGNILSANLAELANPSRFVERSVYASDGEFAAKLTLRMEIESDSNFPPQLVSELPVPIVYKDDYARVYLGDLFVDPEGDPFEFVPLQFPEGYSVSDNGYFAGAGSSQLPIGELEGWFEVTDGVNTARHKLTFDHRDSRPNLLPEVIDPIGTVNVEVGKMFRVSLEDRFIDPNGDQIFFSYVTSPPVPLLMEFVFENMVGGVPDASWLAGSPHTIELQVRDTEFEWIQHDFTIVVTDPNAPPQSAPSEAIDEVKVTASSDKVSGGGSMDLWLLAGFLLLLLSRSRIPAALVSKTLVR